MVSLDLRLAALHEEREETVAHVEVLVDRLQRGAFCFIKPEPP